MKTMYSPTKPGPDWVKITPEIEKMFDDFHAGHEKRLAFIKEGYQQLLKEVERRRMLGEDI